VVRLFSCTGLTKATIAAWSVDPQVVLDASGKKGSLFDAVEDLDSVGDNMLAVVVHLRCG
jgi:hypothetical protein